jgi:NADP-dependent 3-hydroxy acid dehydrogenase YdfG
LIKSATGPSSRLGATASTTNTKGSTMRQKKIALVTGAAQGIGLACAEALLGDRLFVILADVKTEEVKSAATRLGDMATLSFAI